MIRELIAQFFQEKHRTAGLNRDVHAAAGSEGLNMCLASRSYYKTNTMWFWTRAADAIVEDSTSQGILHAGSLNVDPPPSVPIHIFM